jgi:hypothetical protein
MKYEIAQRVIVTTAGGNRHRGIIKEVAPRTGGPPYYKVRIRDDELYFRDKVRMGDNEFYFRENRITPDREELLGLL